MIRMNSNYIVFDFGGVILDFKKSMQSYPATLSRILGIQETELTDLWSKYREPVLCNRMKALEYIELIVGRYNLAIDATKALAAWKRTNIITESMINWELLEFITKLRKNNPTYLFTDQIDFGKIQPDWVDEIEGGFCKLFKSYIEGYCKPHANAFQNIINKINANSDVSRILFIDDDHRNISMGERLGIKCLHYDGNNSKLFTELRDLCAI